MSLILDAINRSQRERANPGEVPGVATQHYSEATVAPGAWRQGLLGLALVVALGVIAWLLLRPQIPVPAALSSETAAPAAPSHAGQVGPYPAKPASQPTVAPSETERLDNQAVPSETREASAESRITEARPAPIRAPAASRQEAPAAVAALYTNSAAQSDSDTEDPEQDSDLADAHSSSAEVDALAVSPGREAPVDEEPVDIEALMLKARAEMVNNSRVDHPAPFLADLSQQRKDAIPTLLYSAHDYRADGGKSSVLINGKTAHAGSSIGKGVTVDEILPDSVVLSFAGQQFRLTALNSWVNL